MITRTSSEINEQIDLANEGIDQGSKFPGMSYEEGIKNTIDWLYGNIEEPPMED